MTTPRLGAPELVSGQAVPETTVNEALYWLDAASLGGFKFIDRDLATPPGSPSQGDTYLVASSATGAWAGHDGDVALYINTSWSFVTPEEGFEAWVADEDVKIAYNGSAWGITGTFDGGNYVPTTGGTMTGDLVVPAEAYGAGWDGSNEVPTKNDVYDKIETLAGTIPGAYTDEQAQDAVASLISAGTNTGIVATYNDAGNAESIAVDGATAAQVRAGTANKVVTADVLQSAMAVQTLTDGATVSWDMSTAINAKVTLGGNRTLAVSNPVLGATYSLGVIQDGTGSRTMTWPSSFDWGTTGAPTLTTTASKRDRITVFCTDASTPKFDAFLSGKGFS